MPSFPVSLYRAAECRLAETRASEDHGISAQTLMSRAGASAFRTLRFLWPRARRLLIACGPGNNGGDGGVLARLARDAGYDVSVHATESQPAGDGVGIVTSIPTETELKAADVIVDALLGTGLARDLDDDLMDWVSALNFSGRPIFSLDLPSGLDADTGRPRGAAIQATATLCLLALKPGLFTAAGRACAGDLHFDPLDVPTAVFDGLTPAAYRLTEADFHGWLKPRARHVHKGDCGRVLIVGGQPGMIGAVRLAGEASYRVGAGLVTIATYPRHAAVAGLGCPEIITEPVDSREDLRQVTERADVIGLGPGLGREPWGIGLFEAAVESGLPMVVDADALHLLAQRPGRRPHWVLTPHPGEAARLLDVSTAEVQSDRLSAAAAIAMRYGGVCVLKGSGTLIASEDDLVPTLCDLGNPGMASGGMGDLLTGVIAGLMAQGLSPAQAARLGVWLHARAGDLAAARLGERGLLASDLINDLRALVNRLSLAE